MGAIPDIIKDRLIQARGIKPRPLRLLVYGEAGIGKTTLLGTAQRPLLVVDFESGADIRLIGMPQVEILRIYGMDELSEVLKWLYSSPQPYRTIAFDGLSLYTQAALREILQKRERANPTWYEWGVLAGHMREVLIGFLRPNAHTVFTALLKKREETVKENGKDVRKLVWEGPDLPVRVREMIRSIVDLEAIMWKDKEGERWLGFVSPQGIAELKDRSGKLSTKEEPDITKVIQKVFPPQIQIQGGGEGAGS